MSNDFKVIGNFYFYDEKLNDGRGLGILAHDDGFQIFISNKHVTVEEFINLSSDDDLDKLYCALKTFLQVREQEKIYE